MEQYFTSRHQNILHPGDQYTIYPNTLHWFQSGEEGCIVSEFCSQESQRSVRYLHRPAHQRRAGAHAVKGADITALGECLIDFTPAGVSESGMQLTEARPRRRTGQRAPELAAYPVWGGARPSSERSARICTDGFSATRCADRTSIPRICSKRKKRLRRWRSLRCPKPASGILPSPASRARIRSCQRTRCRRSCCGTPASSMSARSR